MIRLHIYILLFAITDISFGQSLAINRFIDSISSKNSFNGTIVIQQKSKISYQKSFGLANFQFRIPNTINTKYKIASITKLFTSVLMMQLYEEGKIDVNKTIKEYLKDYKGEGGDKVTIHQLLNHTSGMANIDTVKTFESALVNGVPLYQKPRTSKQLLDDFCSDSLVNEPGKVFDYNNADYIVLGKIIERVCNKAYDEVLKAKILDPLKMNNSGLLYQQNIIEGLADSYLFRDDIKKWVPDLPVYMENWYAAGSMYSTANDLLKFANALFGSNLIKKETLAKLLKPGLDDYGYGLWSYQSKLNNKNYSVVMRPGRIMGIQTMLFRFLDEDITIIMLSNATQIGLDNFVYELSKRIVL